MKNYMKNSVELLIACNDQLNDSDFFITYFRDISC